MNEELNQLLKRYDNDDIDDAGMARLREMVTTPEGRKQALRSGAPESIFFAEDQYQEPEWQPYWENFAERLETQNRWKPERPARKVKPLAMAAMFIIAIGAVFLFQIVFNSQPSSKTLTYTLSHREAAEVLPDLQTTLGGDATFSINSDTGEIIITGSPEAVARAHRTLEMIDREPLALPLRIALLEPTNPISIQQVDAMPTEEIDLDAFRLLGTLEFSPLEGQQFRKVIDGRYETTCFVRMNAEGTEAQIINLSVYDHETRTMLVRATDITLAAGWTRTVKVQRDDSDAPAVAAISLLPGNMKEEK